MTVAHGLSNTILEFSTLDIDIMNRYADDFIEYYENLPPFLILEKDNMINYFVHAGISPNAAMGMKPTKADHAYSMYKATQNVEEVEKLFSHIKDKEIILHVGHNYQYDNIMTFNKNNFSFVMNDIGLGKREIKNVPEFLVI